MLLSNYWVWLRNGNKIPIGNEATKMPLMLCCMSLFIFGNMCIAKAGKKQTLQTAPCAGWHWTKWCTTGFPYCTYHNNISLDRWNVLPKACINQRKCSADTWGPGQGVSDAYIVDLAYQCIKTQYDQSSPASSSLVQQTTGLSSKGPKGWVFVGTYPAHITHHATLLFHHLYTKKAHFNKNMLEFIIQHNAAFLVKANKPPVHGPGHRLFQHICLFLSTAQFKWEGTIFHSHANYCQMRPWCDTR